jgi:hypothetical protein
MLYLIILIGLIAVILIVFLIQKNSKKQAGLIVENSELMRSKLLPLWSKMAIAVQEFDRYLIFNEQKSVYTRRPVTSKQGKPLIKVDCTHAKYGCDYSTWEEKVLEGPLSINGVF